MLKPSPINDHICGGQVVASYVWHDNILDHSAIRHESGQELQGFPHDGHFIVKVTKAIVRTSHPVRALANANTCTLITTKHPGAPTLTDVDMAAVEAECEMPSAQKKREMQRKRTHPVVAEKIKTRNIFAKEFPTDEPKKCSYSPHSPARLKQDPVKQMEDYEKKCNTANVVHFSPPLVLVYGSKYEYQFIMKSDRESLLEQKPIMIVNFYGHIYETGKDAIIGCTDSYFSGLTSFLLCHERDEAEPEPEYWEYESGIDDFGEDSGGEELEDYYFTVDAVKALIEAERRTRTVQPVRQLTHPTWTDIAVPKPKVTYYPKPPGLRPDDCSHDY